MHSKKHALFFDTVVLSNFAYVANGIVFLRNRYKGRIIITTQVYEEIAKANYEGLNLFDNFKKGLQGKDSFQRTSLSDEEYELYISLLKNLGTGESSCIAAAYYRESHVVTDDRLARNFCKERNVPITGTIGILKAACLDEILELKQADQMLSQMIENGFYSPIQKISDIF